ncbi:hypothetical protein [Flavobacterium sp.]|uniref:hypothetical protein n=1 Tax=Flavobacterium sp. TaxID=239 RepID=UPI004048603A
MNSYSVNKENFSVTRDTLKSTLSIYKDTIKLNKTYEIKSMDFVSKSGNKLSGLLLSPKNNIRTDLIFLHFHGSAQNLMIPCMYRTKKRENFSKSYKEMMIYAKFCPFTGKPLYEDSVDSTT